MLVPFVDDPTVVQGFKRIPFLLIHWNKYFLVHHLHAPPFPLDKDVLKNVIALYIHRYLSLVLVHGAMNEKES